MTELIQKIYHGLDRGLRFVCRALPKPLCRLVERLHRFLTYAFMGGINTAVDYIVFYLLYKLFHVPIELSQGIGYLASSAHGYMLNSNLTFLEGKGRTRGQFFQYVGLDVLLLVLSSLFMGWIEQVNAPVFLMKLLVAITVGFIHYIVYKLFVFKIQKEDDQR